MVEVIHLDSCILRGLMDSEDKRERRSEAIHLLNSSPGERFRISILAVGEVMGLMGERRSATQCAEAAVELHRLLQCGKIDLYGIGKGTEVLDLATQLMSSDHFLRAADAMLLAAAFEDPLCSTFATSDRGILRNPVIWAIAESRKVRILDVTGPIGRTGIAHYGKPVNMMLRDVASEPVP